MKEKSTRKKIYMKERKKERKERKKERKKENYLGKTGCIKECR